MKQITTLSLLLCSCLLAFDTAALSKKDALNTQECYKKPASEKMGLDDILEFAICNNPDVATSWAALKAKQANIGSAYAKIYPSLEASVSAGRRDSEIEGTQKKISAYNSTNAALGINYVLYDFGATDAAISSAMELFVLAQANLDTKIQQIFSDTAQGYFRLLAKEGLLDAAKEASRAALENYEAAKTRRNIGSATKLDELQAKTSYSQALYNQIQAEIELKIAQSVLANTMGLKSIKEINLAPFEQKIPKSGISQKLEEIIKQAFEQRSELKANSAQIRAANTGVEAAKTTDMPTLSAIGSIRKDFGDESTATNKYLGLSLLVPIFGGFNRDYKIESAKMELLAKKFEQEKIKNEIALDVWQAYYLLEGAIESIKSSKDTLESATLSKESALGRYKAGVGTILELTSAQSALENAKQKYIESIYNLNISKIKLLKASGALNGAKSLKNFD